MTTERLDNFTDAAFASAISLLGIGGAGALRNFDLTVRERDNIRGELFIWLILAATGLASALLAMTRYGVWASMLYATLPATIGLFVWRHDWDGTRHD